MASSISNTSVLIKPFDVSLVLWAVHPLSADAAFVAGPAHLSSATTALPTTLVAWLVHLTSVAVAPLVTFVAWVMHLCCGMLLALLI